MAYKLPTYGAITLESDNGLSNVRGTIAMARTVVPDSATSQFFINQVDNTFLDYNGAASPGYAVFGQVISDLSAIDNIAQVATTSIYPYSNVPVTEIAIASFEQTVTGSAVTADGALTVDDLEAGAQWSYSIDGGVSWTTGTGTGFSLPAGSYGAGDIQVRQTDAAGNPCQTNGTLPSALLVESSANAAFLGTSGNNNLVGESGSNILTGGLGDDTLAGGGGDDTAVFSGSRSGYSLSLGADGSLSIGGADGADSLSGIEALEFADGTVRLGEALPAAIQGEKHYAKVQAYFLGLLGRAATAEEASEYTALLQSNQSRVWWYDSAQTTMDGSLMSYLQAQAEYTALTANDSATIIDTIYQRLTGATAPQELLDHYEASLTAGTLQVRGVANKLLGELHLSPKGDGSLGTVAGFADNRSYLDGAAYIGYLNNLDAIDGIDIANLDDTGNLVIVGMAG
jgi:Ca2+-binding RTX toxin-like protein